MLTSVYVHFPWCLAKCPYCDFASGTIRRPEVPHRAYAEAVLGELARRARGLGERTLVSVFFGGGTPSLWAPEALGAVLGGIRAAFAEAPDLEVTVECNPTSLDAERARAYRDVGVNRLSIGVQSLDAGRLRYLGRLHDAAGARKAVAGALTEMTRVSADLMFGMPGQRPADFLGELEAMLTIGVDHVSAYALTIEPDTQFGALHRKGKLTIAPEEDFAETFLAAQRRMADAGFGHYEVSNYARPGQESRHNQHYWRGGDYLGLGAGAVGCLSDGGGARRYRNDPRPERYLDGAATRDVEVFDEALDAEARIRERLMLGLRTAEGVDLAALGERVGADPHRGRERALERRTGRGDLLGEGDVIRVPPNRWLHLDAIVADLF